MSYRLPDTLPEVREPSALLFDVAKPSHITVEAGTITRINIPCAYSRRMSRNDLMLWDHMGWPSPSRRDRSDYAPFLQIRPIDLEGEGYTTVSAELPSDYATYVQITGTIDHDHVVLTIDADTGGGVEVPFVVFLTGHNDEVGDLRDMVTKGIVRILPDLVGSVAPGPTPDPDPEPTPDPDPEPDPEPEPTSYTIAYNANGGAGSMPSQTVTRGESVTLATNQFSRTNYDFASWNTVANGSGTSFSDGETITPDHDYTLYAQWDRQSGIVYIMYDANGGTGYTQPTVAARGRTIPISSCNFTYVGHTFSEWNTRSDGTGTSYGVGTPIILNDNMTLYAMWT